MAGVGALEGGVRWHRIRDGIIQVDANSRMVIMAKDGWDIPSRCIHRSPSSASESSSDCRQRRTVLFYQSCGRPTDGEAACVKECTTQPGAEVATAAGRVTMAEIG